MQLLMAGKFIPYKQEVVYKVEELPKSVDLLFEGTNVGKLVVKVDHDQQ